VVDDNATAREIFVTTPCSRGFDARPAASGHEGLAALQAAAAQGRPFGLALIDRQMPEMDGFEATRRIRAGQRGAALTVIAMTANAMSGDRERCPEAGMDDLIAKPLDVAAMSATLREWLGPGRDAAASAMASTHGPATARPPAVLDRDAAPRRVAGNAGLIDRLAWRFVQSEADGARRISLALAGGDRDADLDATRELDGAVALLVAAGQGERARTLARLLVDFDFDGAAPVLEAIGAALDLQLGAS
jgi:polar amino acid transport system substrate-binding protein